MPTVRRRTAQLRATQLELVPPLAPRPSHVTPTPGLHLDPDRARLWERLALRPAASPLSGRRSSATRAPLHDIGKIGIPDRVLRKPGSLDAAGVRRPMRTHTTHGGAPALRPPSPLVRMAEAIARAHHERWDGSRLPARPGRESRSPWWAASAAICDVFDALGSRRPYKEPWAPSEVIREIARGSGSHFDPALVTAFLEIAAKLDQDAELTAS